MGVVGVGIDAVDLARFRTVLARRPTLAGRVFTDAERAYAARAADPVPRLAARFAAKEAAMKALRVGIGAVRFADLEVVRAGDGAPTLSVSGGAGELADRAGVSRWHLSLTHSELVAVASVVAESGTQPCDPS